MSLISGGSFFGAPGNYPPPFPFSHNTWNNSGGQFHHVQLSPPMMIPTWIEWSDTPDSHVFRADLHGFHNQDVKVTIEDERVLCISGEKKIEKEEKMERGHRLERATGRFTRRFHLPENAMLHKMTAHFENGTLSVTIPKKEVHKKTPVVHTRRIDITG